MAAIRAVLADAGAFMRQSCSDGLSALLPSAERESVPTSRTG